MKNLNVHVVLSQGELVYVTECSHCRSKSKQNSKFYELQLSLKGRTTTSDCLRHYFMEEVKIKGGHGWPGE